jgi:hypothetical protein
MAGGGTPADLAAVEARLRAILAPYETRLEQATIYNLPTLRRRGARAHDWFAFVKPGPKQVGFFLLPVYTYPELAGGLSPALRRHLTGKSAFNFRTLDEPLMVELEAVTAAAFERYMAADAA